MKTNTHGAMKPKAHVMWQDNDRSHAPKRELHRRRKDAQEGGVDPFPECFTEATRVLVIPADPASLKAILKATAKVLDWEDGTGKGQEVHAYDVLAALGVFLKRKGHSIPKICR